MSSPSQQQVNYPTGQPYQAQPTGSQTQLYPNLYVQPQPQNTSVQGVYFVPVVQTQTVESQPLLTKEPSKLHPTYVVHFAKKSKRNCCCVLFSACCCMLCLVGIIIGVIAGAFAAECANPNYTETKSFTAPAFYVTSLSFSVDQGSIDVSFQDVENVTITLKRYAPTGSQSSDFQDTWNFDNNTITFQETINRSVTGFRSAFNWCQRADLEIVLPINYAVSSNVDFTFKGSNGEVSIAGYSGNSVTYKSINVDTSNAHIQLENTISANTLSLTTSNGAIEGNSISSNQISTKTSNAKINVESITLVGAGTQFSADTSNAEVVLNAVTCTAESTLIAKTSNGAITAYLNGFQGNFNADTSNDDITITGAVTYTNSDSKHKAGTVGSGTGNASFYTSNAAVTLAFS